MNANAPPTRNSSASSRCSHRQPPMKAPCSASSNPARKKTIPTIAVIVLIDVWSNWSTRSDTKIHTRPATKKIHHERPNWRRAARTLASSSDATVTVVTSMLIVASRSRAQVEGDRPGGAGELAPHVTLGEERPERVHPGVIGAVEREQQLPADRLGRDLRVIRVQSFGHGRER